ncbi:MAG: type II toxin-antitoxin system VapB family antitoxin [Acidimicrobiia bacterium]
MKTTIEITDELLQRAKQLAAEEGSTLRALVEAGLRHQLERRTRSGYVLADASFDGRGTQPGASEGDWSRIRELIYEARGG